MTDSDRLSWTQFLDYSQRHGHFPDKPQVAVARAIVAFGDLQVHNVYDRRYWAGLEWPDIPALRSSEKKHGWAQDSDSGKRFVAVAVDVAVDVAVAVAVAGAGVERAPPVFGSLVEHNLRPEGYASWSQGRGS